MAGIKYINPYKLFVGSFLPNWLLQRPDVSPGAKLLYARLAQYAGKNGEAWPSQDLLAREIGIKERNLRNYIAELQRHKLIESIRQGFGRANHYKFLHHPWITDRQNPAALDRQNPAAPLKRIIEENHSGSGSGEEKRLDAILNDPAKNRKAVKGLVTALALNFGYPK